MKLVAGCNAGVWEMRVASLVGRGLAGCGGGRSDVEHILGLCSPCSSPETVLRSLCWGPAVSLQLPPLPGGICLHPPEWCASLQASAQDPGPLCSLPRSSSSGSLLVGSLCLGGKNFCIDKAVALGTPLTT